MPVEALTWANGWAVVSSGSVALTVVPRCSPLDRFEDLLVGLVLERLHIGLERV